MEIEYVLSEINESGEQGEVLEECGEESAFGFYLGSGEVLEALEKEIMGKSTGEPFEVVFVIEDNIVCTRCPKFELPTG